MTKNGGKGEESPVFTLTRQRAAKEYPNGTFGNTIMRAANVNEYLSQLRMPQNTTQRRSRSRSSPSRRTQQNGGKKSRKRRTMKKR
jgi:hypothetical protein